MMTPINTNFYGDNVRWFLGSVVDNNDERTSNLLTRVQVRILGVHGTHEDGVPDEKLPWASVVLPTTEGGTGYGQAAQLDVGAQVFGIFLDGKNSQYPLVLGSIPYVRTNWRDINSNVGQLSEAAQAAQGSRPDYSNNGSGDDVPVEEPTYNGRPITTNETGLIIYQYFYNEFSGSGGNPDAIARGIYGNFYAESSLRTNAINPADGTDGTDSIGLAQWNSDRARRLRERADAAGVPYTDLQVQLDFTMYELNTYSYLGKAGLLRCETPAQAAVHFRRKFEIPASYDGRPARNGNPARPLRYSDFGDPVWTRPQDTGYQYLRYGEEEAIERAVNTVFEAVPPSNRV